MTINLSIGKYRALQQVSNSQSVFTVLAIDHQDSLRRALHPAAPMAISDEQLATFKTHVVSSLWNEVSGILLDPVYGIAQIIEQGLPASVGLLAELEKADYNMNPLPLAVDIRPHWSVGKIKRMGANGVKLFYYYDPDNAELCQQQDPTITQAVTDCLQYDIPLYAEPIVTNTTAETCTQKIIQSAQKAEQLGADILKLEFPIDITHQPDRKLWQPACEELTANVNVPWVLLSAGVTFELFCKQVEIACASGASGFIVGRAVWGDACNIKNEANRIDWLETIGRERLRRLADIANQYAQPWTTHYKLSNSATDWYVDYPEIDSL